MLKAHCRVLIQDESVEKAVVIFDMVKSLDGWKSLLPRTRCALGTGLQLGVSASL